ncbi:MAG: DUF2125 domain-containing protein [Cucumibacter sp.]
MRRFVILGLVVLLVVLLWSGLWQYGAEQVRAQIEALAENPSASLACGRLDIAGFPFRFDVTCSDATVVRLDLTARTPEIKATALAYRPGHVIAFVKSPVALSDAFFGTERELRFEGAEASLRLSGFLPESFALERFSVELTGATLHDVLVGDETLLTLATAEFHLLDSGASDREPGGLAAYATAAGLDYPEAEIEAGTLIATAMLTRFPRRLLDWSGPALLSEWVEASGALTLEEFAFTADGLDIAATGNASLDASGLINGTLRTTSKGLIERLDLEFLGDTRPLFIGTPGADGSYTNQFSMRGGYLFAGIVPVPLLQLAIDPLF